MHSQAHAHLVIVFCHDSIMSIYNDFRIHVFSLQDKHLYLLVSQLFIPPQK
jgi:hypothetical protein